MYYINGGILLPITDSFCTQALSKITSTGAMTFIFIEAIEHGNASTYGNLLSSMRNAITNAARRGTRGLTQVSSHIV